MPAMKDLQPLRISRFDAVTSALMTLMLFAAAVTGALMLLWLVSRFESPPQIGLGQPVTVATGNPQKTDDSQQDFEQPGDQEFELLVEPTLADEVEAVTTAASHIGSSFANHVTNSSATPAGGLGGNSRPPGPDQSGEDIIPRSDRWQLNFTAKGQFSYAKQLDHFKIELGVVGGSVVGLDIVNHLTDSPQSSRLEDASTEKRLYFMFKRPSPLMQYERAIHHQAGLDLQGRKIFKLIPPELENQLAKIELDYATAKGHPSITKVVKTVFESTPAGSGYEFHVVTQRYRTE